MEDLKILLFDPSAIDNALMENFFTDYKNIRVKTVIDFDSAWEIYQNFSPGLIIMEPYGTKGMILLKKIRDKEMGQKTKTILIAATSQNMIGDRKMFLKMGFDFFVPKPINFNELATLISELITGPKTSRNQEKKCRILTVTADPLMSAFFVRPLEKSYPGGAAIDIMENSNEIVNFLHQQFLGKVEDNEENEGVDVVLLDLDLPGRRNGPDAYQLAASIKFKYPQIICGGFTTFSTPENQKRSLQAGMDFLFNANDSSKLLAQKITRALYPV